MEPIVNALSDRLRVYVDMKHGENVSKAANVLDQEYSLVYRLYRRSQKGVTFFQAYEILKKISPADYQSVLEEAFPNEMLALRNIRKDRDEDSMDALNRMLSAFFDGDASYSIYAMTSESKRLTVSEIYHELGEVGRRELSRLVAAGALRLEGEEIVSNLNGYFTPSELNSKAHLHFQLRSVSLRNRGTAIDSLFGYLNAEGVKRFFASNRAAIEEQKGILGDPTLKGDILFVASSFCGPFSSQADKENIK